MTVLILRVMVSQTLAETITECHDAFSSCVRLLSGKQGEWFACLDAAKVRRSNNNNNNNNKLLGRSRREGVGHGGRSAKEGVMGDE